MTVPAFAIRTAFFAASVVGSALLAPQRLSAHCDTLDGPVVTSARTALENGNITPVLKWVREEDEPEIRAALAKALAVRSKGSEARELADTYFFETLVRVHRAGEGAPFTGLKPAGTNLGPALRGADEALETGSVEALVTLLTEEVAAELRGRFASAHERKKHADDSVEEGRAFVAAYVEFVHYVEALSPSAETNGADPHRHDGETAGHEHGH